MKSRTGALRRPSHTTQSARSSSSTAPSAAVAALTNNASKAATDCLVAVLDSCGSVKFSVFSFYTQHEELGTTTRNENEAPSARSVTTKIPAANASGVS